MAEVKLNKINPAASKRKQQKEDSVPFWNREIELGPTMPAKEKQAFFQMLAVLLKSGLSISESLEILEEQASKKKIKALLKRINQSLNEGMSLFEAFEQEEKVFDQFEIYSIKMGEASGKVPEILADLAAFHEKRLKLKRKLVQAFAYPVVVILVAGGVLGFMLTFVVPMFEDIFKRFNAQLPDITLAVMTVSRFLRDQALWLIGGILTMVIIFWRLRKSDRFQSLWTSALIKVPLFGPVIHKIQLSRFCYSLSLMLRSQVNLDQALKLLDKIVRFPPIQLTIQPILKNVVEGETLFNAISKHKVYPPMFRQMVRVGEKTARLDEMLGTLGKNLEEETDGQINTLTALLEPLLIVILGLLVGIILVSMYLPMFELSNTIQ